MLSRPVMLLLTLPLFSQAAPPPPTAHPLDEPMRLLGKAQQAMSKVEDYSCTLIKQERIAGKVSQPHVVTMMVRHTPFSVYLKWHQPKECIGQEACYVAGKNMGMMRAKSPGILGTVGFVSVDPNDPRAKKTSNHVISESGIANVLLKFNERWAAEKKFNRVAAKVGEYEYNKRRCIRAETTYKEIVPGAPYYRSVVYFDKELEVPIRVELYDWPKAGGAPGGEVIEMYSYINLKLNAGVPAETFNK